MGHLRAKSPFLIASVLALGLLCAQIFWAARATQGENQFPLDDTYIHLTMARELLQGNWGVEPGKFANASSSPLYPVLLAGVHLAGVPWLAAPLVLNGMAMLLVLGVAAGFLAQRGWSGWRLGLALGGIILFLPLPYLAQMGMEHVLHTAATLLFFALLLEEIDQPWAWRMAMLAPALVLLRLEGCFSVAIACGALALRGRWKSGVLVGGAGLLAFAGFAWFSWAHGGSWLPNPVLLKGGFPPASTLWGTVGETLLRLASQFYMEPSLLAVLGALAWVALAQWRQAGGVWLPERILVVVALTQLALHMGTSVFATTGLYRYRAYLVALGWVAVVVGSAHRRWLVLSLSVALTVRATQIYPLLPEAIVEIHRQQVQMARFFGTYYPGRAVMLNDIGAVQFFAPVKLTDVAGLGDDELFRLRLQRTISTAELSRIGKQRQLEVIAIYEKWFQGEGDFRRCQFGPKLPPDWWKAGEWDLGRETVSAASRKVSFFAVDPMEGARLTERLREFEGRLPAGVVTRTVGASGYPQQASRQNLPDESRSSGLEP